MCLPTSPACHDQACCIKFSELDGARDTGFESCTHHTQGDSQAPKKDWHRLSDCNIVSLFKGSDLVAAAAGKEITFGIEKVHSKDVGKPREFPEGVFGQKYPQNITTQEGYPSVNALKVKPEAEHKDADRLGVDGLPHVGAVVWPGQAYYATKQGGTA